MKKEVWVSICGLQSVEETAQEPVETISAGDYFKKQEKHFLLYDSYEEDGTLTRNQVKISADKVELLRRGKGESRMDFWLGKRTASPYLTPYGSLLLGVTTGGIALRETENSLEVCLEYVLDMLEEKVADCRLIIRVTERT